MIKTIIFDLGGVILKEPFSSFLNQVSEILGIELTRDGVEGPLENWMRGGINFAEFLKEISWVPVSEEDYNTLSEIWLDRIRLDSELLSMAKSLKSDYKLAILSNADFDSVEKIEGSGHVDFFHKRFYSCELGMVKPEKEIYEHVLKELGDKPEDCVFIDDKPENIDGAKKAGMHGIVFESNQQLKKDLKKLGLKVE
jgi:epoxide hydrolase-like predicted phosphatase